MKDKVNEIQISYKEKISILKSPTIKCSKDSAELLFKHWSKNTIGLQESFKVLLLNNSNKVWSLLLAAFPAVWFIAERIVYYALWWVTRLTNPDLVPRRISREPLLEPTIWYGLAVVLILIVVSYILTRRTSSKV